MPLEAVEQDVTEASVQEPSSATSAYRLESQPRRLLRTTAGVNFRDGPSISSEILAGVGRGRLVREITRHQDWVQVLVAGRSGWIHAEYLETVDNR